LSLKRHICICLAVDLRNNVKTQRQIRHLIEKNRQSLVNLHVLNQEINKINTLGLIHFEKRTFMKTLLTLLLLSNAAFAYNTKINEPDKYLKERITLAQHFEDIDKSTQCTDFFTVGADGACNYSSIHDAIYDFFQSPLLTIEIRINTNNTYFENIMLGNADISLTGGYSDCSVASASGIPSNNQSLIHANNSAKVLTIQGTTQKEQW
jgi:hypothetical protein